MNQGNNFWRAVAWIATAAAVIAATYITGSAWCVWGMLIPEMA